MASAHGPRVVLVGEAPAPGSNPRRPLDGDSGRRLARILGVELADVLALERRNLVDRVAEEWGLEERRDAQARARRMLVRGPWRRHVLLGRHVETAYRRALGDDHDLLAQDDHDDLGLAQLVRTYRAQRAGDPPGPVVELVAVPHPSGRCRTWNDPAAAEEVRPTLRAALGLD